MKKVISRISLILAILLLMTSVLGCSSSGSEVKNIIYIIADGMGDNHIKATAIMYNTQLEVNSAEKSAHIKTFSADSEASEIGATDSAAGGTALSSGYKTNNGFIGLTPDEKPVKNLAELAREKGKKIGIVTTSKITDATPAAFSAHVNGRGDEKIIAEQQLKFKPNVLFGAVTKDAFTEDNIKASGMTYVTDKTQLDELSSDTEYSLGLFNENYLANRKSDEGTPSLLDMSKKAIALLDGSKEGFFLVIEGAYVDKWSHSNSMVKMTEHMKELDDVVAYAKEYMKNNPNTVIIITADHETGDLQLPDNVTKDGLVDELFNSLSHTSADVPLFSYGKNAKLFQEDMDNTDVAKRIATLIGVKDFGDQSK